MPARTLDQILSEVTARSDPSRNAILTQINDVPNQTAAQEQSLNAKLGQANENIMLDARRRGMGFSGVPIGEQTKYAATDYAPALANLRSTMTNRKTTLEQALAGIGSQDYATANDIYNQERAFEEQQRQFNLNYALQQAAERRAAASAGQSGFPLGGFGMSEVAAPQNSNSQAGAVKTDKTHQTAYNGVKNMLGSRDVGRIVREYNAILKSANNGNAVDKVKLELIAQLAPQMIKDSKYKQSSIAYLKQFAPQLFGNTVSAAALGNGGSLRF